MIFILDYNLLPLADIEFFSEALKDASFAEKLFSFLLFKDLSFSQYQSDYLFEWEGEPLFFLDALGETEKGDVYGILRIDKADHNALIYMEALLREKYEKGENEVLLFCFYEPDEEEEKPLLQPLFTFLPFGEKEEFYDYGVRLLPFVSQKEPKTSLEWLLHDLLECDTGKIRTEFLRNKLEWLRFAKERKNVLGTCKKK